MGKKLSKMKRKEMLNSLSLEHLKSMYKDKSYWKFGMICRQPKTKDEYVKHLFAYVECPGIVPDRFKGNAFLIKLIKKKARFTTGQKRAMAVNANFKCEICKRKLETVPDVHHIRSVDEGGYCLESNGIVVCPTCHRKAGAGVYSRKQLKEFIKYRC